MTQKLPITITQDGLQALIDAQAGTTNAVMVTQLGLSSIPFVMSPTLEAVPGEFKRLDTIAGRSVSETVIHMVATDDAVETYTVTGVGLYLDSGQLFGVYSQGPIDGALFEKSEAATFLFAVDITFEAGDAALIEFGDTNFLYPPATESQKGVAYLATIAEVAAGVDTEKMVTPATLADNFIPIAKRGVANGVASLDATGKVPPSQLPAVDSIDTFPAASEAEMLALPAGPGDFALRSDLNKTYVLRAAPATVLGNWAEFLSPGAPVRTVNGKIGDVVLLPADVGAPPTSRNIAAQGLVKGGGNLSADRAINVDIATAAEVLAAAINDKAVTPASLAGLLALLGGKTPATRHVDTGGLATGGGDLSADRTITVPKASAADVEAMVDDTKAITAAALAGTLRSMASNGFLRIPGTPLILQWGSATFAGASRSTAHAYSFPTSFPATCLHVYSTLYSSPDDGDEADEEFWISSISPSGFVHNNGGDTRTYSFAFLALGY